MFRTIRTLISLLALAAIASSCFNVFAPLDSPRGDAQLISAGRAALDRGDFASAANYYQKVSANEADVAGSEQAFAVLDQNNAGMGAFAIAFGSGSNVSPGKAITSIANQIGNGASPATRLAMLRAYQFSVSINSASLKGLVQFLSSMALMAEMLAEASATSGHLLPSDLVTDATTCGAATSCGPPPLPAACNAGGSKITDGTPMTPPSLDTATTANFTGAITLAMIQSAIDGIKAGIGNIQATGGAGGAVSGFTGNSGLGDGAIQSGSASVLACYRWTLQNQGIGSY